jgi:hypothetical protein
LAVVSWKLVKGGERGIPSIERQCALHAAHTDIKLGGYWLSPVHSSVNEIRTASRVTQITMPRLHCIYLVVVFPQARDRRNGAYSWGVFSENTENNFGVDPEGQNGLAPLLLGFRLRPRPSELRIILVTVGLGLKPFIAPAQPYQADLWFRDTNPIIMVRLHRHKFAPPCSL